MSNFRKSLLILSITAVSLFAYNLDYEDSLFTTQPNPSALNFDKVEAIVKSKKVRSVEELLKWISETHPDYLKHFTLMHKSQSLQGSSPENPRAIVFGEDSHFILSFNGDKSQKGFDSVEMIQTRPQGSGMSFEFREIRFSANDYKISESNPMECARCHGVPLKPIWEQYDQWPGAYGKNDDAIIDFTEKFSPLGAEASLISEHTEELKNYRGFLSRKDSHPRYQYLKFVEGTPVTPYSPASRGDYRYRPNLRLTDNLTKLQVENLTSQILSHPHSKRGLKPLVAYFLGCKDAPKESLLNLLKPFELDPLSVHLSKNPKGVSYFEGLYYLEEVLGARLYQEIAKVDRTLPTFSKMGAYGKQIPYYGNTAYEAPKEPEFNGEEYNGEPVEGYEVREMERVCKTLLSGEWNQKSTPQPLSAWALCNHCHGNGPAPKIDFSEQSFRNNPELVKQIRERLDSTDPKFQMPPDRKLSLKERNAIERFLNR